jgi:hypothetical protein
VLAVSPVPFAVLVITLLTTVAASGVDDSADITPAIMADIRPQWIGLWIVYPLALVFGSVGMLRAFGRLRTWQARGAVAATVLSVLCTLVNAALNLSLSGFSADRLGSMDRYHAALEFNIAISDPGVRANRRAQVRLEPPHASAVMAAAGGVMAELVAGLGQHPADGRHARLTRYAIRTDPIEPDLVSY